VVREEPAATATRRNGSTGPTRPEGAARPAGAVRRAGPARPGRSATGGFAADPRVPVWIRRAVIAVVIGVAVGWWLNWRIGLTVAALIAIVDTVYQSKTMSVIPASARVIAAQRRTQRRLATLRPSGFLALNARSIPGSPSVIDHLVVGPPGVYAVDSEYWDRRLSVRAGAGNVLYHGPANKKERLVHARWEATQAARLLGAALQQEIRVRPVMVIYGPKIPWAVARLRGVDVFSGAGIRKYFRRQVRASHYRLSSAQVNRIYEVAAKALPPV
jgi:Nuclease-related domain